MEFCSKRLSILGRNFLRGSQIQTPSPPVCNGDTIIPLVLRKGCGRVKFRLLARSCVVCFLSTTALFAQLSEVAGRITDPQGKAVAAASVRLLRGNMPVAGTKADSEGAFRLKNIPPGNYALNAEA